MRHMYLQGGYSAVREEVMRNVSEGEVWSNGSKGECSSFVGFVQVLSDKTGTMLESTVPVAYLVHAVPLNSSAENQ